MQRLCFLSCQSKNLDPFIKYLFISSLPYWPRMTSQEEQYVSAIASSLHNLSFGVATVEFELYLIYLLEIEEHCQTKILSFFLKIYKNGQLYFVILDMQQYWNY